MANHKTVKVRVFAMVNAEGKWAAIGWSDAEGDDPVRSTCSDMLDAEPMEERGYWITAELPVPVEAEIVGEATTDPGATR